jgi:predicted AlkP superfamily phosphohydrolase/phosphomutase
VVVNLPLDQTERPDAVIVNSWLTVEEERRIYPLDRRERYRRALEAYRSYPTTFEASLDTHLRDLCELEASRFALVQELLRTEEWGHFFVLFSSTDWLGHAATGLFLDGDEGAREAFTTLYEQLDGHVGWLRENAPDADVVVLSDHGQCEETHIVRINGVLRELGFVSLMRERPQDVAATLSDRPLRGTVRVPAALRRLGQRRVTRSAARAARTAFQRIFHVDLLTPEHGFDADRVLSRAFTPTVSSYAVYTHGCDAAELAQVREALAGLELDDGRPALDGIWTLEELYGQDPAPPAPTFFFAPALGVRPAIDVGRPFVERARVRGRGAHQRDGIVLMAGPDVRPTELQRPSLMDICPTLLWVMDADLPAAADGRVLYEALTAEAAARREATEVDTAISAQPAAANQQVSPEVERRLRDLGYLE